MGGVFRSFGDGVGISRNEATACFLSSMVGLGMVTAPLGVWFSVLTC